MNVCKYCKKNLNDEFYENKIGFFCSKNHYEEFIKNLSNKEYIELQNRFCVCSDD